MTLTIKRKYLIGLGNWLIALKLNGPSSRARTKIVNLIQEAVQRMEEERKAIIEEYADKNEDKSLVIVEKDGQENYHVSDDKIGEFNKEIAAMFDQDAEITAVEVAPSLMVVKDLVLNCQDTIDPEIAGAYEKWCESFESIKSN